MTLTRTLLVSCSLVFTIISKSFSLSSQIKCVLLPTKCLVFAYVGLKVFNNLIMGRKEEKVEKH